MPEVSQQPGATESLPPLTRERFARGLTQGDLAARAGLSREYLSRLEVGKARPTLATAERLAQVLGVELRRLFPAGLAKHNRLPRSGVAVPSLAGDRAE